VSRRTCGESPETARLKIIVVWERIILGLAGAAAPLIGLAVRGSRRNRLRQQVEAYTTLAASVEAHDAESAARLRQLVSDIVDALVDAETYALRRRFDAANLIAVLFFLVPSIFFIGWAWQRDEWWRWLVIMVALFVAVFAGVGGGTQLWKTHEDGQKRTSVK
jgi:hypothetical protein